MRFLITLRVRMALITLFVFYGEFFLCLNIITNYSIIIIGGNYG